MTSCFVQPSIWILPFPNTSSLSSCYAWFLMKTCEKCEIPKQGSSPWRAVLMAFRWCWPVGCVWYLLVADQIKQASHGLPSYHQVNLHSHCFNIINVSWFLCQSQNQSFQTFTEDLRPATLQETSGLPVLNWYCWDMQHCRLCKCCSSYLPSLRNSHCRITLTAEAPSLKDWVTTAFSSLRCEYPHICIKFSTDWGSRSPLWGSWNTFAAVGEVIAPVRCLLESLPLPEIRRCKRRGNYLKFYSSYSL